MTLGIMQPYFLPYIGYWQLINAVDEFIIYDNIEYTKKGWINRNRILLEDKDFYITIPLKKDSDYLDIKDRCVADTWKKEKHKLLHRINAAYKKSPYFDEIYTLIEKCVLCDKINLFEFILNSLNIVKEYLEIRTPLTISSTVPIDHTLKSSEKVKAFCKERNATIYINAIGGVDLYDRDNFKNEGIELYFIKANKIEYKQFSDNFIPWLSIIDVLMFNPKEEVQIMLGNYQLV